MTISQEQVLHIAHLSHLKINEDDATQYAQDLTKTIDHIDTLPLEEIHHTSIDTLPIFQNNEEKTPVCSEKILQTSHLEIQKDQILVPKSIDS
jgi:Asp-tRNA(Asn)/Glu-tRNA(Gln) amidotransferase C subunit